jgi:hypothetical protein
MHPPSERMIHLRLLKQSINIDTNIANGGPKEHLPRKNETAVVRQLRNADIRAKMFILFFTGKGVRDQQPRGHTAVHVRRP